MSLKLYNTLTHAKESFEPLETGRTSAPNNLMLNTLGA